MVSEGKVEADRTPDLRRCERIGWPRPLIEELAAVLAGAGRVRCWCEDRKGAKRIIIAMADFSYALVLDDRGDYVLPWTAYAVERDHQRQKLEKAWTAAKALQKAGAAPWEDGPVTPATPGGRAERSITPLPPTAIAYRPETNALSHTSHRWGR